MGKYRDAKRRVTVHRIRKPDYQIPKVSKKNQTLKEFDYEGAEVY
jgi:hypothetical protein